MNPFPLTPRPSPKRHITRQLLLISSARVTGHEYLEASMPDINQFLKPKNVTKILFIPYAVRNYDDYVERVSVPLRKSGFEVIGIHKQDSEINAVKNAECILVGGGNTYLLLNTLYQKHLVAVIRESVLYNKTPYVGFSAGAVVTAENIGITICSAVVHPPSLKGLSLIPFYITPHYERDAASKRIDVPRDNKVKQFLKRIDGNVVGLREGSSLLIEEETVTLKGDLKARLFSNDMLPQDIEPGADLSYLLGVGLLSETAEAHVVYQSIMSKLESFSEFVSYVARKYEELKYIVKDNKEEMKTLRDENVLLKKISQEEEVEMRLLNEKIDSMGRYLEERNIKVVSETEEIGRKIKEEVAALKQLSCKLTEQEDIQREESETFFTSNSQTEWTGSEADTSTERQEFV